MMPFCCVDNAGYLEYFPQLAGQTFGELCFWFDDAIVMGLVNRRSGACQITPDPTTMVSDCRSMQLTSKRLRRYGKARPSHCLAGSIQALTSSVHTAQQGGSYSCRVACSRAVSKPMT